MQTTGSANAGMSTMFVIFGGTGDLTHRKLMPALYNLVHDKLMPERFSIVVIGRRDKTTEQYRDEAYESIGKYSRNNIEQDDWAKLRSLIYYYKFDFTNHSGYKDLKKYIEDLEKKTGTEGNRVFYLAVSPDYFETIVSGLKTNNLAACRGNCSKLVIEKPFGKDLYTAKRLNESLLDAFTENSIYRIDHYLGKDMIQNIMVLRFCNLVFESLWSSKYIDNIQITLSEKNGIGSRGGYYEQSGAMRDMMQNHILQILSLVAMEPPVKLDTDAIRTEKVKVLQAIELFTPELLRDNVVCGQYGSGIIDGKPVKSYREEEKVAPDSTTETFLALKLQVDNFRWAGTPFYIRTGKRMGATSAEIVVQFKSLPNVLYFKENRIQEPNLLVIKIQPSVGVFFQFNTKDFRTHNEIVTTKMNTGHLNTTVGNTPEAYERLIYDILRSDSTLFSRWDEVEASWTFADRIIAYKEQKTFNFPNYDAGTMGPGRAFELLARDGRQWWNFTEENI